MSHCTGIDRILVLVTLPRWESLHISVIPFVSRIIGMEMNTPPWNVNSWECFMHTRKGYFHPRDNFLIFFFTGFQISIRDTSFSMNWWTTHVIRTCCVTNMYKYRVQDWIICKPARSCLIEGSTIHLVLPPIYVLYIYYFRVETILNQFTSCISMCHNNVNSPPAYIYLRNTNSWVFFAHKEGLFSHQG